jgi:imidazolonepropionase-like amidohydrolase
MLDVRSGQIIQDVYILVKDDRISDIGGKDIARNVKVIELGDMTLLPGLIDMHTHLTLDLVGDWYIRPVKETAADLALRGARNARKTLLAGYTTVRDIDSTYFTDIALMHATENNFIDGPRIIPVGHAITITGGHGDFSGFVPGILEREPEFGVADGREEVLRAVRYQIKHGAKWIKFYATAGVYSFEGPVGAQQYSEEEMKVIVEEAARHGLKVAAHGHGTEGIIAAIKAGVHSIEHGSMLNDEAIRLMKKHGTYLVPTTYLLDAIDFDALPLQTSKKAKFIKKFARESHRKAIAAGVKIAYGTDACVFPHGDNGKEFAVLVQLGMAPIEAIRTATLNATDLLGVDDRGIIEKGRLADMIAVRGNPLENVSVLEEVQFVMKDGKVYKMPRKK